MTTLHFYLQSIVHTALSLYFREECEYTDICDIPWQYEEELSQLTEARKFSFEERIVFLLALAPHLHPQSLDILFVQNKDIDRPYTEFGGRKGISHGGFLPTGQTAVFILAADNHQRRDEILHILNTDHWFYNANILRCEGAGEGEPFLSGRLIISEEVLAKLHKWRYTPEYTSDFPAKRITTSLEWTDLVLPCNLLDELDDIIKWLQYQDEIRQMWHLDRIIKSGYRCLFYGPPGTGKTLTANVLGKQNNMEVYRIDLSMLMSKYIGETEKNLAKIFDKAAHKNWILFFDEADALFGQRTETNSANDRHANQEVAYLLQRIEDFSGMVILATNLKNNIDEAFFRRFQSILYFPMPDKALRLQLWQNMIPKQWLPQDSDVWLTEMAEHVFSGGSMVNIIQNCAIRIIQTEDRKISKEICLQAIEREKNKIGIGIKI